jgi:hypothetical protein
LCRPTQTAPGKPEHADDDQHDTDNRGRFHEFEATTVAGLGSN